MNSGSSPASEIRGELTKQFRKTIWRPFMLSNKEYRLMEDGDRIAVCISGGKDSLLLAVCMQEFVRHSPLHVSLRFLTMNPGFSESSLAVIRENARLLELPLEIFETDIYDAVEEMGVSPCYMCAKMRRGYLYRRAQADGCNKIALGHHFDDAAETLLMSILYSGQIRGMRPYVESENVEGMSLIRPLYHVRESAILEWRDHVTEEYGLSFASCSCRFHEKENDPAETRRAQTKALIEQLSQTNPDAAANIFRSGHNVMLDSLNGWKQDGILHLFRE